MGWRWGGAGVAPLGLGWGGPPESLYGVWSHFAPVFSSVGWSWASCLCWELGTAEGLKGTGWSPIRCVLPSCLLQPWFPSRVSPAFSKTEVEWSLAVLLGHWVLSLLTKGFIGTKTREHWGRLWAPPSSSILAGPPAARCGADTGLAFPALGEGRCKEGSSGCSCWVEGDASWRRRWGGLDWNERGPECAGL